MTVNTAADMTFSPGDIVEILGDSILRGQLACVIRDHGETVYCCSNGGYVGSDFPIRHELSKDEIKAPFSMAAHETREAKRGY